jgi:hypothetical protein
MQLIGVLYVEVVCIKLLFLFRPVQDTNKKKIISGSMKRSSVFITYGVYCGKLQRKIICVKKWKQKQRKNKE